jgi:asparagine synthase (glutamine-hydrolysing)
MCGIAGFVAERDADAATLRTMTDALSHRGPDGAGYFLATSADGRHRIGLGHRRLAIIDLEGGAQPMSDVEQGCVLTFNGEIYNYRELRHELIGRGHVFRTSSDTEVVLAAYRQWGEACLTHLHGMFAFALWDERRQLVFLARDRFGKKPLFVMRDGGNLAFASEIKALLSLSWAPRSIDPAGLSGYFSYRYVPGPRTLFAGIGKLPPAHYAVFAGGTYHEARYYDVPDSCPRSSRANAATPRDDGKDDAVAGFLKRLDTAVAARMVSDVPFGAFLSGGIDSSAVVGLMTRHSNRRVMTFSVGFDEAAYSELEYAGEVARHFNTDHAEVVVRAAEVADLLPEMTSFRDAPVAEAADVPLYRLSQEAAKRVKMILSGEGSDEILGGYPKHVYERFVLNYQSVMPASLHRLVVTPVAARLPYGYSRIHTLVETAGLYDTSTRMARWFGALTPSARRELLAVDLPPALADIPRSPDEPLRGILAFDQQSWLPDNLLERGDRMTMAASIEARMPFMDHQLAEYVSLLPDSLRVKGMTTKWLLRRAMERILPHRILTRPKVGFRVPISDWFRGQWRDFVRGALLDSSSLTGRLYRPARLAQVIREHEQRRHNHEKLLWSLLALELFQRQYRLAL